MQWSVLLPVVLTLVGTNSIDSDIVDIISNFCYTKWALESFVIANAQRFEIAILIYMQSLPAIVCYVDIIVPLAFFYFQVLWSVDNNKMCYPYEESL